MRSDKAAAQAPSRVGLKRVSSSLFAVGGRRRPEGIVGLSIRTYAAGVALFTFYAATVSRADILALSIIFLCLMLVPSFLLVRATHKSDPVHIPLYDWVLSAVALVTAVYFVASIEEIATRISLFKPLTPVQLTFAGALVLLTLEVTRRTVGLFLMLIVLIFVAYNLFGDRIEGPLGHGPISLNHFLDISVYTTDGLFGVPVRVAATYAFLFVMFGTFLERAGGGAFFFNVSAAITGRSPGGPAKVAVVSSGLFGTMSGSPTSDVVTTGAITIPMMKRLGYKPSLAGGIEVAASTGGSLIPPVMGSAAFIMAEFTSIPYAEIVIAAILPAALYYISVLLQVHLRAARGGMAPLDGDEIPKLLSTLLGGWIYLLPLTALVVALLEGYSPTMVAAVATVSIIIVSWLKPGYRLGPKGIFKALADTTVRMIGVTGACAAAGLVIGGITMTGLAAKFSFIAFSFAGDMTLLALGLAAIVTIILGLGMPTPSAYVLAAVLIAPTLVGEFAIPLLNAHLFLLYFAVLSALTPPVAVAAYAAAAIAEANPLAIAATAVRFALVAFVVPFSFVFAPGVLDPFGSPGAAVQALSIVFGTVILAVAVEGWLRGRMPWPARLAAGVGGLMLFAPSPIFILTGAAVGAAGIAGAIWWRPGRDQKGSLEDAQ
ncbi:MAG: TRAP transporter fused permease subunit [Devosia sp.]